MTRSVNTGTAEEERCSIPRREGAGVRTDPIENNNLPQYPPPQCAITLTKIGLMEC